MGDEIDDFFFMTRGVSAFVRNYQPQTIIGVIDPCSLLKSKKFKPLQFFGCEDSVFNHLNMLLEIDKGKDSEI